MQPRSSINSDGGKPKGRKSINSDSGSNLEGKKKSNGKTSISSLDSEKKGRTSVSSEDSSANAKINRRAATGSVSERTDISDADTEIPDENDPEQVKEGAGFMESLMGIVKKGTSTVVKAFVDYGPPYSDEPYSTILGDECAKPVINHWKVHNILNRRWNPNQPDPDDLYYYPIHWCARNIHFTALKMLVRAGANLNVTNELGCTALDMCVMLKHPADKRKDQLKMAKFLLEKGALVNTRDKGGFSPIDHAATNQDLDLIQLLLEYGADLVRENYMLVAPRAAVLKNVHDPDCFRVLYERLNIELREREERKLEVLEEDADEVQKQDFAELLEGLARRRQKREERRLHRERQERLREVEMHRRAQMEKEQLQRDEERRRQRQAAGLWIRDGNGGWLKQDANINGTHSAATAGEELLANSTMLMQRLARQNQLTGYSATWQRLSGGGQVRS